MKRNLTRLIDLMLATNHLIRQRAKRRCQITPVSAIGLRTLLFISNKKLSTMTELADHLGVRPPTATSMINHLVKDKLVRRTVNGDDRRIVILEVTPKGKREAQKVLEKVSHKFNLIFAGLSARDASQFINTLEKVIYNYQKYQKNKI